MFLISKIVRGRRLLHELQHELAQEEERETKKQSLGENVHQADQRRNFRQNSQSGDHHLLSTNSQNDPNFRNRQTSQRRNFLDMSNPDVRRGSQSNCLIVVHPAEKSASLIDIPSRLGGSCYNLHLEVSKDADGKTTRQKTDASLPTDEEGTGNALEVPNRMRRTSSMPSVSDVPQQHKISMQTRVHHYNYNARLNKLQKRSLRFTWQRLQTRNGGKKIEDVFAEVFERLTKQVPIMRDMFTTRAFLSAMSKNDVATLRDHARIIVRMFDLIIQNLDKEEGKRTDTSSEFDPRLLGKAHGCLKPYRFTANIWEILGETIIDVVLCQEAVRDLPGAGQAWVVLTACVVDQLRAGFEHAREPYGVQQQQQQVPVLPIFPSGHPPMCPHMRSFDENHTTVEINHFSPNTDHLSLQREHIKSRTPSVEQNTSGYEESDRHGQSYTSAPNNTPRKPSRKLTDANMQNPTYAPNNTPRDPSHCDNVQEESYDQNRHHHPKYSSTSADRPLVCSRLSSRSSSSTKSQPQSLRQSGF